MKKFDFEKIFLNLAFSFIAISFNIDNTKLLTFFSNLNLFFLR